MLFGLGSDILESYDHLIFKKSESIVFFARLNDLTELAYLNHSTVLVMVALCIEFVPPLRLNEPAETCRCQKEP